MTKKRLIIFCVIVLLLSGIMTTYTLLTESTDDTLDDNKPYMTSQIGDKYYEYTFYIDGSPIVISEDMILAQVNVLSIYDSSFVPYEDVDVLCGLETSALYCDDTYYYVEDGVTNFVTIAYKDKSNIPINDELMVNE